MNFIHIYNGIIGYGGVYYKMIEFKIEKIGEIQPLFTKQKFHAGWFVIENEKLYGPVSLDLELIKKSIRKITDSKYNNAIIFGVNKNNLMKNIPTYYLDKLNMEASV